MFGTEINFSWVTYDKIIIESVILTTEVNIIYTFRIEYDAWPIKVGLQFMFIPRLRIFSNVLEYVHINLLILTIYVKRYDHYIYGKYQLE